MQSLFSASLAGRSEALRSLHRLLNPCVPRCPFMHHPFNWVRSASSSSTVGLEAAHRLHNSITSDVTSSLQTQGFAVVDGVFGDELSHQLREEIASLQNTPLMHLNSTHLVKEGSTHLLEKEKIWEAEAMATDVQEMAPALGTLQWDKSLMTMLNIHHPGLDISSQALKLQYNSGGGSFPIHHDSDELLDGRVITAIFYLNPAWEHGCGGELRLYPFPLAEHIDIPPVNDRVVLFSSTQMPHRVLPTDPSFERYCFTCWLSQARRRPNPRPLSGKEANTPTQAADFLLQRHVRKHLVKLMYSDEWAESLVQSHPPGPARDQMLATHAEEVQLVAERLLPYIRLLLSDEEQQQAVSASSRLDRARLAEALRDLGSAAAIMQWLP